MLWLKQTNKNIQKGQNDAQANKPFKIETKF